PQATWEIGKGDTVVVNWSVDYDVSEHNPEDDLTITFEATEVGALWDSSKGTVRVVLHYPFQNDVDVHLDGSGTGLVYKERHFSVHVRVTILAGYSEFRMPAVPKIAMPGSSPTGETFTTIDCTLAFPRVEVHPVVPVPQVDQLPPRPPERR